MLELLYASILGLVEGLTEFLPVSSSGHLILTSSLLNLHGPAIKTFEVFIQLGAILAVVVLYRNKFRDLLLPSSGKKPPFSGIRGLWMLFLTCLPASLVGLLAHDFIKERLFNPITVAMALAVGAVMMILLERFKKAPRYFSIDEMTPKLALGIGCCQCMALWPGFSRSASTIMGGMILGAEQKMAAEYSFIAAVPIMFAATFFDLFESREFINSGHLAFFAVGFVVSFISALLAIKVFIRLLGKIGLTPFAWYRLALAPLVYWFFA
ncbi:undecaprenyl-diphosphate phosphatase [Desulfovibrio sp. OttesenSCG-928-C06]|nr:undecaprenyl-diphosphate phosphatase [Desulfovibrio sp. OttesenSCG-928-C06]